MKKISALIFISIVILLASAQICPASTEAYFSPEGGIQQRIVKEINNAGSSIDIAIFTFTTNEITYALEAAKARGVLIRIILDRSQSSVRGSESDALKNKGFNVRIKKGLQRGIMHNKFAIFDRRLLLTGSYNWTYSAEHFNRENAIFIDDANIISAYQNQFEKLWR